jgi:hypothetical protein
MATVEIWTTIFPSKILSLARKTLDPLGDRPTEGQQIDVLRARRTAPDGRA